MVNKIKVVCEALVSEDDLHRANELIDAPTMAKMPDGKKTPIRPAEVLCDMGYNLAIFPSLTGLAAAAVERALNVLRSEGTSASPNIEIFDFAEFNQLIGFQRIRDFQAKWSEIQGKAD